MAKVRLSVRVINHSSPKTQKTQTVVPLEKGQIWMLQNRSLEVVHVGKLLVQFRLTKAQAAGLPIRRTRVGSQLESISKVTTFLLTNKAVLAPVA
jgi:hypothetical protein